MGLLNFKDNADSVPALYKCHIGTVIDNKDPKNLCRVKVSVPGILSDKTDIWAMQVAPTFPGVTYAMPKIGQKIRIWFLLNDPQRPVYGLDYTHVDSRLSCFDINDYGYVDDKGNSVKVSGEDCTVLYVGDIDTSSTNLNVTTSDTITLKSTNTIESESGAIKITGNTITINGDTTINGDLVVNGSITATGDVVAGGISLKNHVHAYSWTDSAGSGSTEKPS